MSKPPLAWINAITGDVTTVDCSDTLLWAPLYLAPPTREPLSEKQIEYYLERLGSSFKWDDGFIAGIRWAERRHGITGADNE